METDQFRGKYLLDNSNIEKYAPEKPGVIIIYDEGGKISKLSVADDNIKTELSHFLNQENNHYFTFRQIKFNN